MKRIDSQSARVSDGDSPMRISEYQKFIYCPTTWVYGQVASEKMEKGTSVHSDLEVFFRPFIGKSLPKELLPDGTALPGSMKSFLQTAPEVEVLAVEHQIRAWLKVRGREVPVRGTVDLLCQDADGLIFFDWKTTFRKPVIRPALWQQGILYRKILETAVGSRVRGARVFLEIGPQARHLLAELNETSDRREETPLLEGMWGAWSIRKQGVTDFPHFYPYRCPGCLSQTICPWGKETLNVRND